VGVAGDAYVVVNSEEHVWLKGNKPDVFVVPDGCWESKQRTTKLYSAGKYGILASNKVYGMCRSVGDMKMRQKTEDVTFVGAFENKDRGQIMDYALDLGGSVNCFLVNNALQFELYEFRNLTATRLIRGCLKDSGSGKFLQSFLCRPNDPVPEPTVSLNMAINSSLQVKIVSGKGFLGAGGSAHVYQVTKLNECYALKVFKVDKSHLGHKEVAFLSSQLLEPLHQSSEVPSIVQSLALQNGALAVLISPVGCAMKYNKGSLELAMKALARLHQSGVCHGDARVPNFIFVAKLNKVIPIDFTWSSPLTGSDTAKQDILRLISSFYKLKDSNDLNSDALSQLSCALPEDEFQAICSLVQTYIAGGYRVEHVASIAKKVWEIYNAVFKKC